MELKELIDFLGVEIDPEQSIDEFKGKFKEKFTTFEEAKQSEDIGRHHIGKRLGSATRELIRKAKEAGVEFEEGELKDENGKEKPIEDLSDLTLSKLKTSYENQIKDLKDKAGKTDDKKLKDLEEKLNQVNTEKSQYEESVKKLQNQLEEKDQEMTSELKKYKINTRLKDIKSNLRFVDDLKPVHKKGFDAELNDSYQFDLNDNDELVVKDKDGKFIESPDKAGEYLKPKDVVEKTASENGLLKQNNGGQASPSGKPSGQSNEQPSGQQPPLRKPHPAAQRG